MYIPYTNGLENTSKNDKISSLIFNCANFLSIETKTDDLIK